jgi:hypothetical protein
MVKSVLVEPVTGDTIIGTEVVSSSPFCVFMTVNLPAPQNGRETQSTGGPTGRSNNPREGL